MVLTSPQTRWYAGLCLWIACFVVFLPGSAAHNTSIGPHQVLLLDGKPFTCIMLYHQQSIADLETFKKLGMNTVDYAFPRDARTMSSTAKDFFAACAARNLHVMADYSELVRARQWENLSAIVKEVMVHPMLLLHYVIDEPEYYGLTEDEVNKALDIVKRTDPHHVTYVVHDRWNGVDAYAHTHPDIWGVDYYPIRWNGVPPNAFYDYDKDTQGHPTATTLERLRTVFARYDALTEAPIWCILQCHNIPGDDYYGANRRYPTPAELKGMLYLALNSGADAVQFYNWLSYGNYLALDQNNPAANALKDALPKLLAEYGEIHPYYQQARVDLSKPPLSMVRLTGQAKWRIVAVNYSGQDTLLVDIPGTGKRTLMPMEVFIGGTHIQ